MAWIYSCTECGSVVNPGGGMVVLVGLFGGAQMLIGFSPEPGDYTLYLPPGAELERGEAWTFHCPVCHGSLVSDLNENLCALDLDQDGAKKRVLFSRICGEHATFVVAGDTQVDAHGEDADEYEDTVTIRIEKR
jgi:transcription elongation factor Elf1